MAPILRLDDVSLAFGSRPLLEHASLQVEPGERVCVVGRNGEGKSSLLRLAYQKLLPDSGAVWLRPGTRRAVLEQDIVTVQEALVHEVVAGGLEDLEGVESLESPTRVASALRSLVPDGAA